jgi:hypothetical protein
VMSDDLRGNVIVMPVMMGVRESSDPAFDPGAAIVMPPKFRSIVPQRPPSRGMARDWSVLVKGCGVGRKLRVAEWC